MKAALMVEKRVAMMAAWMENKMAAMRDLTAEMTAERMVVVMAE